MERKPLIYMLITGNLHKADQIKGGLSCIRNYDLDVRDFSRKGVEALKEALKESPPDILVINAGEDKGNVNLVNDFPELKNMILISSYTKDKLREDVGREKIDRFTLLCGSDERNYTKLEAVVKNLLAKIVTDKLGMQQKPEGRNPADES